MAESLQHKEYVSRIVSYIETIPTCCADLIEADLLGYNTRVTKIGGSFYPDVYYRDFNTIIIGEAKTDNDIENEHTSQQLISYINEATRYNGKRLIILSTSFYSAASFHNIVVRLIRKCNVHNISFILIDPINGARKI